MRKMQKIAALGLAGTMALSLGGLRRFRRLYR